MGTLASPLAFPLGGPAGPAATAIQDRALNPLALPASIQMLGFTEGVPEDEVLRLRIYLFLIEIIRQMDADEGQLFLKRYLEGPQQIWGQTQQRIFQIKDLWNVTEIADEHLQYLKNIVGWTPRYDPITSKLDFDGLRRLIKDAIPFWKTRGTETNIEGILTQVLGARLRVANWFDYRWILDETGMGHDVDGADPWIISTDNTQEYNVRIVDDGTLDRDLAVELLKLTRPTGERVDVTWLSFLDQFFVDNDLAQWTGDSIPSGGSSNQAIVANGQFRIDPSVDPGDELYNDLWTATSAPVAQDYVAWANIRGALHGLSFNVVDSDNAYLVYYDPALLAWRFGKVLAGVPSNPAPVLGVALYPMHPDNARDFFHTIRVSVVRDDPVTPTKNIIKTYVDGVFMAQYEDTDFLTGGRIGLLKFAGAGSRLYCKEIEALRVPNDSTFIDINS